MVNKARLLQSIANLVKDKRIDGISDLRDESDRDGMRMVVELKKEANAQVVLKSALSLQPDAGNGRCDYARIGGRTAKGHDAQRNS